MPRKPSVSARVTAYQIECDLDASVAIRETYLARDNFSVHEVAVGGRPGLLVRGLILRQRVKWADVVTRWTGDPAVAQDLGNATASCVLLLSTSDEGSGRLWALCFGMGFQMLEPAHIVSGMGRRLAVRSADPDNIRSLTHSRLDSRAYVARTSIPGGDSLLGFGAGDLGDLVSRLVGPAALEGVLASDERSSVEIRGADAINVPLARDGDRLLSDLDAIEKVLDREPHPELAMIEQLRALKRSDPRVPELEAMLDEALGTDDCPTLGLAWPTELADEAVPLSHFVVTGRPRGYGDEGPDAPSLDAVLEPLRSLEGPSRIDRLDRMRVQAFSDEDVPASNVLPARRWLSFEASIDGHRFCLHDGRWYGVDEGLSDHLSNRVSRVFSAEAPIGELPDWPADADEAEYNRLLAKFLGGVCLDRQMVVCESHPRRGFEAADVLTPSGVLLHVKAVHRSAPASHLFAQAGVSTQTLLHDATATTRLREIVQDLGGDPAWLQDRPREVVLVMGNRKEITDASLPSFARMRLVRLTDECTMQNVALSVVSVQRLA